MTDGEVEGHSAVTASSVGVDIRRSHSRCGSVRGAVPDKLVALAGSGIARVAVTDGEV